MAAYPMPAGPLPLPLVVKFLDRAAIELTVGRADTVLSLKERIQEESGVAAERQKLTFNGKIWEDEQVLHQTTSALESGSTIHCVVLPEATTSLTQPALQRQKSPVFVFGSFSKETAAKLHRGGKKALQPTAPAPEVLVGEEEQKGDEAPALAAAAGRLPAVRQRHGVPSVNNGIAPPSEEEAAWLQKAFCAALSNDGSRWNPRYAEDRPDYVETLASLHASLVTRIGQRHFTNPDTNFAQNFALPPALQWWLLRGPASKSDWSNGHHYFYAAYNMAEAFDLGLYGMHFSDPARDRVIGLCLCHEGDKHYHWVCCDLRSPNFGVVFDSWDSEYFEDGKYDQMGDLKSYLTRTFGIDDLKRPTKKA